MSSAGPLRAAGALLLAITLAGLSIGAVTGPAPAWPHGCERGLEQLDDGARRDLARVLEVLGVEDPRREGLARACRLGRRAEPDDDPAAAPGRRSPALVWKLLPEGLAAWLVAVGEPPGRASELSAGLRSGRILLHRESPWYPGAGTDEGPRGDVLQIRTEWRDGPGGGRFASAVEAALRGDAPALDRLRDWRLRSGGERVSIELLAEEPVEITPLGADPWDDVEFERSEP